MIASSTAFYGDAYTSVPLQFRHVCSQVTVRLDEGLEDFAIQSVSFVGMQQSGRLVGKESTQIYNLICDRQEGHLARLKLELAQKYFKDVLDSTQQQDKELRR